MEYAFAFMMGWCGTKWPGWWRWPRPPIPDPEPWWHLADGIIGGIGGIAALVLFGPMLDGEGLFTTAAVCFAGGLFAGTVIQSVMGLSEKRISQ